MNTQRNSIFRPALWMSIFILAAGFLTACGGKPETYTIGVVNFSPSLDDVFEGLKIGMVEKGYVEGENVTYIYEGAVGSIEALDPAIQKIMDQKVDLILSISTPATQKIKTATQESQIPVVFAPVTDPVASEIVASLTNPGGNLTGIQNRGSIAKGLDWLLAIAPGTQRLFVPHNPSDDSSVQGLAELQTAAAVMGLELVIVEVTNGDEFEAAMAAIPEEVDAIFMLPSGFFSARAAAYAEAGIAHQLPVTSVAPQTEAGLLMSYGHDYLSMGVQLSRLVDQIFNGTDPGDLPVETPEFFLSINLVTAQAIGLEIPDDILVQADTLVR